MSSDTLVPIAVALLTSGIGAGLISLYKDRKKAPVERDAISVTGSQTAVLSLERSLAAETKRADRAEALVVKRDSELARKDARIVALEKRLDTLQAALDAARTELQAIITAK